MTTAIESERPRERLRRVGVRSLSVEELLTLVIGSGRAGASADRVARSLTERFPGLERLSGCDVSVLEGVRGVGPATAARVAAALELGRRAAVDEATLGDPIRGPGDVYRRIGPRLRDLGQEEFHALLLNTRHRVVREVFVTRGILDAALIHPREVFRIAVSEGAAGIILVHNHPSGDPAPSAEDRAITRQLGDAGKALGIPVLDHIVIGRGGYCSLATELVP